MLRPGHASTMTLGVYSTLSTSSSPALSPHHYTYNTRPNTPSRYLTIYLSNNDPTDALFYTSTGQTLYQSRTAPFRVRSIGSDTSSISNGGSSPVLGPHSPSSPNSSDQYHSPIPSPSSSSSTSTNTNTNTSSAEHTSFPPLITRVSRLYGSTAHAVREAALELGDVESAAEGLLIAEMEWLGRTRSSRIRFGDGLAVNQQNAVDVRVDEFLKSTNGRGFSKMFATPDGRTFKWKTDAQFSAPAELVECDGGKRISGPLVTFQCPDEEEEEEQDECGDGEDRKVPLAALRIATRLLPIIDQILVSWVIMERERRSMISSSPRSLSSSSSMSSR